MKLAPYEIITLVLAVAVLVLILLWSRWLFDCSAEDLTRPTMRPRIGHVIKVMGCR